MIINHDNVTETGPHRFVCDASDLGYTAGLEPPAQFDTTLGNGQQLMFFKTVRDPEGDIVAWRYHQAAGCIELVVFND